MMTDEETDRLVAEMEGLPPYRGWEFTYEYPGFFCYSHPDNDLSVFFTPDWDGDETLPIQVQTDDGRDCSDKLGAVLPLPREGRSGAKLFELVQPTLDKILALPRFELHIVLTEEDIEALHAARSYLAHDRAAEKRDVAMAAIDKVLYAAEEVA